MTNSILKGIRTGASSLALSAMLVTATVGGATLVTMSPAFAAISLTSDQTSSLQASLTAAIAAAHGDSAAIEAAIQTALVNAIATYGADAVGSITSAIISISEGAHATSQQIGNALAQASASLAATNQNAANTIASTLANEGNHDEVAAYQSTVTALGYSNLASTAGGDSSGTGDTGSGGGGGLSGSEGGSSFSGGSGSGGGGGCLNPSCTSL